MYFNRKSHCNPIANINDLRHLTPLLSIALFLCLSFCFAMFFSILDAEIIFQIQPIKFPALPMRSQRFHETTNNNDSSPHKLNHKIN